jgi:pimeloyl-ACP methyl ester carboxylesterase
LTQAYSEYGDPARPSILLLHGIRLGREIWEPHARVLAARYHVVTLDLPGHGALAHIPFNAESIASLMDEALGRCAAAPLVAGYSLGGYVAMDYASRRPERTRGLLLAGCTLDVESWKRWPYEASARLSELMPEPWLERFLHVTLRLTLPKTWADIVGAIPFNRDVISHSFLLARENARFSEKLVYYRRPVLFVNGEYDLIFRMDERRFLARVQQSRLRIIRRTDHTAPIRRPEEFTAIVREFADRVFASPA